MLSTSCTTLQIQYLRQPSGGRLRFTDNGTYISDIVTESDDGEDASSQAASAGENSPASEPARTAAASLTYACIPGTHDFQVTTLDNAPVRLLGMVTEQPGITYECLGINGAVAPLMLRWNQAVFAQYLRERDPSLIVLAYGTNEAAQSPSSNDEYIASFDSILDNLHRIVPSAAVLVLGPYDRAMRTGRGRRASWHAFSGTERIIADQKQACRLHTCAFYDQQARMGGAGAMTRWVSAGLAQGDRTHLTGTGYRAMAGAFYRDLLNAYKAYQQTGESQTHAAPRSGARPMQAPVS